MKRINSLVAAGILFLSAALGAAPLQQSDSVIVGNTPANMASDPVTGRIFVSNAGIGRGGGGNSVAMVEPNGHTMQIVTPSSPRPTAARSMSWATSISRGT